ncbi:AraC family transcriptional regulator [Vibrio parahaemolyticus]|uniref:AraC family transcriptional regulator n=1 Tax=Vibrio parahaemolyticus TaxID=670 RepID=UPI0009C76B6B|nr:AraC family transcriptional regulator [Vibrio parahaemolyticus]EIV8498744.1 AraC family transcriptional regulator [Vibrio parahaemolyticus]EJG1746757.1 AraC family transcriptional regulator [Vibrio parahaemolyticus]MBE4328228.1 AraC family transcriptional regulator [Vibrio parahaemolyticus]MBE4341853.1 AraC family transcriptional regulator [Vibrio parahaemolyticus]MDF4908177.1 AraC family transcriptional regulator [Vibrio parahaemolyticus]
MNTLAETMQQYVEKHDLRNLEGIKQTAIEGVWFYRSSKGNNRQPFVYQSGIIVLGQGHKNIHIGQTPVQYGPDDYLVVGVPMPLECEAFATNNEPLLGISIDISPTLLHKLVKKLEAQKFSNICEDSQRCGLKSVRMNDAMLDACKRLMKALCNDLDVAILGESLLEEIVYRTLVSKEGHVLFELAHQEGSYARVAKALNRVHAEYHEQLNVQTLAEEANMSVSAFHQAFRSVTLESPLQYIKKVRLNKARDLIQLEGKRVNDAARLVGYSSPSQFSREYKRHFNETPRSTKA